MPDYDPEVALAKYISEVDTVTPLAKNEESKLFRELAGSGDWHERRENAARRLIESHLLQVLSFARKHATPRVHLLDLIGAGNRA